MYAIPIRPYIGSLANLLQYEGALNIENTILLLDYLAALGGVEPIASNLGRSPAGDSAGSRVHFMRGLTPAHTAAGGIGEPSLAVGTPFNTASSQVSSFQSEQTLGVWHWKAACIDSFQLNHNTFLNQGTNVVELHDNIDVVSPILLNIAIYS